MARENKVLVVGENSAATLAVIRSLGRHGVIVDLATSDVRRPAAYSKYVRSVHQTPVPGKNRQLWIDALASIVGVEKYDLVMPATEGTALPLADERARIERFARCAVAPNAQLDIARDKWRTVELAERVGVPVPRTSQVTRVENLQEVLAGYTYPVVIKPISSKVWSGEREVGVGVRVAENEQEAHERARLVLMHMPVLIQEHVEGQGVGQEFLCRDGEVLMAFQHDRVREYRGSGGSTYRVSAPLDTRLLEASKKLLNALRWTGVIMIEYRRERPGGSFWLMELNGRFWGSLPLPVAIGVDFPYALYCATMGIPFDIPRTYREGVFARSIFEDVREMRSRGMTAIRVVSELIRALANLLLGVERWDVLSIDDPVPFFVTVRKGIFQVARKFGLAPRRVITREEKVRMKAAFKNARHVLFICYGNINRSAFAEAYLASRKPVEVRSAGEYPTEGRPATEDAKRVAAEYNVSLEAHRSTRLKQDMLSWADIVLTMDERNTSFVREEFPGAAAKVWRLGDITDGHEVPDPHGKGRRAFERSFSAIARAVDELLAA